MSSTSKNRRKKERKRQRKLQQQQQQQSSQQRRTPSSTSTSFRHHGDERRGSFLLGGSSQLSKVGTPTKLIEGGILKTPSSEERQKRELLPDRHSSNQKALKQEPALSRDAAIREASDDGDSDSDSSDQGRLFNSAPPKASAATGALHEEAKREKAPAAATTSKQQLQQQPPQKDAVRDGPGTSAGRTVATKDQGDADASPFRNLGKRRRTALEAVAFVYPKGKDGTAKPYEFGAEDGGGTAPKGNDRTEQNESPGAAASPGPCQPPTPTRSSESIDDILFSKRKRTTDHLPEPPPESATNGEDSSGKRKEPPTSTPATDVVSESASQPAAAASVGRQIDGMQSFSSPGRLSGLSVEQAVQDKVGCRPRANSTDGELNLPQRGLCDERIVLESYRWTVQHDSNDGAGTHNSYPPPPRGFVNLGNTCFLNSTMQCLLYLPPFAQSLLLLPSSSSESPTGQQGSGGGSDRWNAAPIQQGKPNHGKRVTHILRNLFRQVLVLPGKPDASHSRHAMAPSALVKALPSLGSCGSGYRFRPGRQEDAHEFLVHLLDAMNDGELRSAGIQPNISGWRDRLPIPRLDETTFVHRVFGGYFRSQVLCVECGHRSNTYDPFLNLSLEVAARECGSLSDALREFTRKETLDKKNRWKCSGCERKVCATKQLTVFRPPLALCMQLKRFSFGGLGAFAMSGGFSNGWSPGHGGKKITKPIDFPAHFHLPLSDGRSCAYSLTGLVIHVGGSASSGHYTACVKRPYNGKDQWFEVDDSFVQAVPERAVLKQRDAYLLFYCRQEVKLEFPTPPLRSSMTASEAMELGRKRARARAESIEQRAVEEPPARDSPTASRNTAGPTERTEKVEGVSESLSHDASPPAKSSLDVHSPTVDNVKVEPKLSADEIKPTAQTSSTASLLPSSQAGPSSASSTSSSSSSDSSSSDSSSAEGDSSTAAGDESHHSSPSAAGTTHSIQPSKEPPQKTEPPTATVDSPPPGRTRIVVDRGAGRGKVEVMLGPRFRKKKAWKPSLGGPETGKGFGLLGNRPVSQWGDDDKADKSQQSLGVGQTDKRSKLEQSEEQREKALKRKVFPDRWDSFLDQGKLKKVKSKGRHEHSSPASSTNAQFQQLQQRKLKLD